MGCAWLQLVVARLRALMIMGPASHPSLVNGNPTTEMTTWMAVDLADHARDLAIKRGPSKGQAWVVGAAAVVVVQAVGDPPGSKMEPIGDGLNLDLTVIAGADLTMAETWHPAEAMGLEAGVVGLVAGVVGLVEDEGLRAGLSTQMLLLRHRSSCLAIWMR